MHLAPIAAAAIVAACTGGLVGEALAPRAPAPANHTLVLVVVDRVGDRVQLAGLTVDVEPSGSSLVAGHLSAAGAGTFVAALQVPSEPSYRVELADGLGGATYPAAVLVRDGWLAEVTLSLP